LIPAVALTGDLMRFGSHFDLNQAREYAAGQFSLRRGPAPAGPRFLLHLLLAQILIMYIPFSKFMHIPGGFFSKSPLYETEGISGQNLSPEFVRTRFCGVAGSIYKVNFWIIPLMWRSIAISGHVTAPYRLRLPLLAGASAQDANCCFGDVLIR
jgi:hypothetical protein